MKARTEAEIKAYVDGYNACYKQFCECLKVRPLWKAVEKMGLFVTAVNGCVEHEPQTQTVDLGNGFSITANGTKTPNYCATCKYKDTPFDDLPCDMCKSYSAYEPKTEPQTEYDKGLKLFADILFDKDKSNQFLEECKAMGIEPQTDCAWR